FLRDPLSPFLTYTLSLHDALPILPGVMDFLRVLYQEVSNTLTGVSSGLSFTTSLFPYSALSRERMGSGISPSMRTLVRGVFTTADRKSTRLNSSHVKISYAVFCLK